MKLSLYKMGIPKENINIPENITEDLAEEVGLHIGDGTMNFYKSGKKIRGSYALRGHIVYDKEHYNTKIKVLYKNLFDLNLSLRDMPSTGVYGFQKWSDDIVNFKSKVLDLPLGRKLEIKIPSIFVSNKELTKSVIRGIFDTDGTLYLQPKYGKLYPRIEIGTTSLILGRQLNEFIKDLNLRSTIYISKRMNHSNWLDLSKVSVRGVEMLDKWMKIIEPHNPKHWKKYQYFIDHV